MKIIFLRFYWNLLGASELPWHTKLGIYTVYSEYLVKYDGPYYNEGALHVTSHYQIPPGQKWHVYVGKMINIVCDNIWDHVTTSTPAHLSL